MSFKAVITNPEKHALWCRILYVLSTIDEVIKITISDKELIAWSINSTDTTLCQIHFSRQFFEEFNFEPNEIVFGVNGLQSKRDVQGTDQKLYSFQINGRHLTTISKKPDNDSIRNFTIVLNNSSSCPETLVDRLLIRMEMESLIVKEYSPQIDPIQFDPIIIDLKYKSRFLDVFGTTAITSNANSQLDPRLLEIFRSIQQELEASLFNGEIEYGIRQKDQLTEADEINYICCDRILLSNILDNATNSITELKLEINPNKLNMTGFTKAIYGKDNDLLRNAMSVTNTINTLDLEHSCLFTAVSGDRKKVQESSKSIIFKLKDFKSFMSISSNSKSLPNNADILNLWFCRPGDPVLFEMKKMGVRMELVQTTDGIQTNNFVQDQNIRQVISPKKGTLQQETKEIKKQEYPFRDEAPGKSTREKRKLLDPNVTKPSLLHPSNPTPKQLNIPPKRELFVQDISQGNVKRTAACSLREEVTGKQNVKSRKLRAMFEPPSEYDPPVSQNEPVDVLRRSPDRNMLAERSTTTIGWGKTDSTKEYVNIDARDMLKDEKIKLLQHDVTELKKQSSQEGNHMSEFGPTQVTQPRGLLD
ncbi:Ddc1p NDAI_0F01710 [Naumovozyma dairenensis CBS 421]|uniref:DNA damage checkpoint protein 1 n=1 Tax=Naumovozyma dairenensis (strain ATCC 10597 / BCRC 20456 / CBS 421 / NBRC 0211 / NRRL Y-12639) TaxID=1071378 RepID=G0WCH9_NAUDC|nr:hypothetical protein NDAI_0F01710 [Naumovozyma dairenensis CBS 421]CCD25490.1 hypothetical protein NDAI_0F01710 [Naumovozyma dairenensis CBS 421]